MTIRRITFHNAWMASRSMQFSGMVFKICVLFLVQQMF